MVAGHGHAEAGQRGRDGDPALAVAEHQRAVVCEETLGLLITHICIIKISVKSKMVPNNLAASASLALREWQGTKAVIGLMIK